ncbi:uncharacterized protein CC84DRAFT_1212939 [Paraphaeosphaeria sporulosa]|uniref:Uncharacterized protein n=1 Tax=Paraphaeosphaeria sporulosa TaxID=1460663 RepID=A0A177CRC2_9PLEO|nr:uncharacterized protein CC84DRAFT_1212939 [Paraphaeosphaeria sporulosa]OAG09518.1 hypothetical protein CC84DRAFT_1212939 [Paraphaeosphaeria sporulosa]
MSSRIFFIFAAAMVATAFSILAKLAPAVYAMCNFRVLRGSGIKLRGRELLVGFLSSGSKIAKVFLTLTSAPLSVNLPSIPPGRTTAAIVVTTFTFAANSKDGDEQPDIDSTSSTPVRATFLISRTESENGCKTASSKLLRKTCARVVHARVPGIVQVPTGGYNCAVM